MHEADSRESHATPTRVHPRRDAGGSTEEANAACTGQAAHPGRQRATVAGAALRAGERWPKVSGHVPSTGRRGRAVGSVSSGEPAPRPRRARSSTRPRPRWNREGDARRRGRPGSTEDPQCSARSTSGFIERGKQPRTMEQRESRLNAHILPTIGDVPVTKWRVEHSRRVMEKGSKTLFSQRGREDLRGQFAAMRKLAWRLGWLDRSIDPLDGLEIGDPSVGGDGGCGRQAVWAGRRRPLMTRLPLFGTKTASPASAACPRRAERPARDRRLLRPWLRPRQRRVDHPARCRWLPGPGQEPLLARGTAPQLTDAGRAPPRVKELLGLPARASLQQVVNVQEAERQRRASLAAKEKDRNLAWWNYPVAPQDELWLFVDTATGLAVKPEAHNEAAPPASLVEENDPDNPGPRQSSTATCATTPPPSGSTTSSASPGRLSLSTSATTTTVLNHYVRAGEDALRIPSASWRPCEAVTGGDMSTSAAI